MAKTLQEPPRWPISTTAVQLSAFYVQQEYDWARSPFLLLLFVAVTAAIFVVAIPAKHADKGKANTNSKPGHTKVKSTELIKHVLYPREMEKIHNRRLSIRCKSLGQCHLINVIDCYSKDFFLMRILSIPHDE